MKYQIVVDYRNDEVLPLLEVDVDRFDQLAVIELRAAINCNVPFWRVRSIEDRISYRLQINGPGMATRAD